MRHQHGSRVRECAHDLLDFVVSHLVRRLLLIVHEQFATDEVASKGSGDGTNADVHKHIEADLQLADAVDLGVARKIVQRRDADGSRHEEEASGSLLGHLPVPVGLQVLVGIALHLERDLLSPDLVLVVDNRIRHFFF